MQATRQQILDYLRIQHGATVKDLGRVLRLTATGIRQHLTILEQEGLVDSHEVRGRVGRPALHYRLSPHGEALYPKQYHRLANALLEEVRDEVGGGDSMQRVLRGVATRLAGDLAPDLAAEEQGAVRLASVTQALRAQDIVCDWEADGDALLFHQRTCPYPEVALRNSITCALDVAVMRELSGMDARLVECILRDDACCTYRLSRVPEGTEAAAIPAVTL